MNSTITLFSRSSDTSLYRPATALCAGDIDATNQAQVLEDAETYPVRQL